MAWSQPTDDQVVESIIFDERDNIDSFVDDLVYSEESYRFVHDQIMNKDVTVRKVRRFDYSRGEKKLKPNVNPWEIVPWLIDLSNPNIRDPSKREGKEFRRKFRVPYPVFSGHTRAHEGYSRPRLSSSSENGYRSLGHSIGVKNSYDSTRTGRRT